MSECIRYRYSYNKMRRNSNIGAVEHILNNLCNINKILQEQDIVQRYCVSQHALNGITLDVGVDDYYLSKSNFFYFPAEHPYCFNGVDMICPKYARKIYLDAPYFIAMRFKDIFVDNKFPAILSVVSFDVDLEDKILYIYQIQGGDTRQYDKLYNNNVPKSVKRNLQFVRRSRMRFLDGKPENIIYLSIEHLAKQSKLIAIAILKAKFNKWSNVSGATGETLYHYIAAKHNFSDTIAKIDSVRSSKMRPHIHKFYWKFLAS